MKYDFILNSEQQALVEQNMELVNRVLSRHIRINEGVCGLGRDDLSQEGALASAGPRLPITVPPLSSVPMPPP